MILNILITLLLLHQTIASALFKRENIPYDEVLNKIKEAEDVLMTGGQLQLNEKEIKADNILLKYKLEEINNGIKNPETYAPSMHFFRAKKLIERSKVFDIIKFMPKGSILHGHNTAMASSEWFIKNITYQPKLFKCTNNDDVVVFTFRKHYRHKCQNYTLVSDERSNAIDAKFYDSQLEKAINLYTQNPEVEYQDANTVWRRFQHIFSTVGDALKYLPVYKSLYRRILQEAYDDGIMYLEIRTSFGEIYDGMGKIYKPMEAVEILQEINKEFIETHSNFMGFKIIYALARRLDFKIIKSKIEEFKQLYLKYPNFIIGFDFVGHEDPGPAIYELLDSIKLLPQGVKYFFHAGETNWYGTAIDRNLLDVILLNTTRIGHGYALFKHPILWNALKVMDIAVEINPISNQVLHLVQDLRNHPASFYISEGIPVVISNDDPGFWNAKGLSYDFYYAFMCFTPADAGLKVLKQLALNSIKYSVLTPVEQSKALQIFNNQWSIFLDRIIENRIL